MNRLWLYIIFLASGFAALLYQIVWQRSLYAIYGINIESVTMVVTAFMLGLGLGSLAGGAISKNPKRPVLLIFALVEAGIGAFGFFSLDVFRVVGNATLALSPAATGAVTFVLVLVPTLLMGGTLPLLVSYLVRESKNVGKSIATLYFVNTLGSAFASAAAVMWVLGHRGQIGTSRIAAVLNFTVASIAFLQHMRAQPAQEPAREPAPPKPQTEPQTEAD
jgi:predicted membrane-bound spermidine synthase